MSRTDEDNAFIEEDAKWLPLDSAVFAVRRCLHEMIAALAAATDYLTGRSKSVPEEFGSMSRRFAVVHTHECRAFEELCDCVKMFAPGSIPESRVEGILRLARILAAKTEDVLPSDDGASHELRCAIQSLHNLACNTSKHVLKETFDAYVETTRAEICQGFKALSSGFAKLERTQARGEELSDGALKRADREFILGVGETVRTMVQDGSDKTVERLDSMADRLKGAEHQIKLARKGQISNKRYTVHQQESAFGFWIQAIVKFGQSHVKEDGFDFFGRKLKDVGIECVDEWKKVVEQWRQKKHLSIRAEVKKFGTDVG